MFNYGIFRAPAGSVQRRRLRVGALLVGVAGGDIHGGALRPVGGVHARRAPLPAAHRRDGPRDWLLPGGRASSSVDVAGGGRGDGRGDVRSPIGGLIIL